MLKKKSVLLCTLLAFSSFSACKSRLNNESETSNVGGGPASVSLVLEQKDGKVRAVVKKDIQVVSEVFCEVKPSGGVTRYSCQATDTVIDLKIGSVGGSGEIKYRGVTKPLNCMTPSVIGSQGKQIASCYEKKPKLSEIVNGKAQICQVKCLRKLKTEQGPYQDEFEIFRYVKDGTGERTNASLLKQCETYAEKTLEFTPFPQVSLNEVKLVNSVCVASKQAMDCTANCRVTIGSSNFDEVTDSVWAEFSMPSHEGDSKELDAAVKACKLKSNREEARIRGVNVRSVTCKDGWNYF